MRKVNKRIKHLLVERGMTQVQLAALIGTTHETVCRVINGRDPSVKRMRDIAEALGVELRDVVQ